MLPGSTQHAASGDKHVSLPGDLPEKEEEKRKSIVCLQLRWEPLSQGETHGTTDKQT